MNSVKAEVVAAAKEILRLVTAAKIRLVTTETLQLMQQINIEANHIITTIVDDTPNKTSSTPQSNPQGLPQPLPQSDDVDDDLAQAKRVIASLRTAHKAAIALLDHQAGITRIYKTEINRLENDLDAERERQCKDSM